jgi:hypothetical protein
MRAAVRSQSPILRRITDEAAARTPAEDPTPPPPIAPLGVFVARRRWFTAVVDTVQRDEALALAFRELPLVEHGWVPSRTKADRLAGGLIWRFERLE